jgi:hypothetical protein
MTAAYATVAGEPASSVSVWIPQGGVWFADVDFEIDPDVSGQVTIKLGALELVGTVVAEYAGAHALQRRVRIVGGAAGWATLLPPKAYHNDAGVRARTVIEDAAREAGETLGTVEPLAERVGVDYVRQSGPASRVLEDVIGGVAWWVDYDGRTHVGARASSTPESGSYEVLEYDPRERLVTFATDDLRSVGIGSVLSERLDAPQVVRELEIGVTADSVRVLAWCGGEDGAAGRLPGLFRSIVARATDAKLFGTWRYRVVKMSSDRAELQAVRRGAGLPDVLPVSMWPGVAGVHAALAPGAEVLVEFIEGDRTMPIVTHFAGKDGAGWTPVSLVLSASGPSASLKLGENASETLAWSSKVLAELVKIQAALLTGTSSAGPVTFGTVYNAPGSATALGTAKTVAE